MHRSLSALVVFVLLPGLLPGQRPDRPERGRREAVPVELQHFTFQEKVFRSAAVDREVPYGIYLPRDYDAEASAARTWPLVVWLHGMFEDHLRFHQRGMGAPVLDKAVATGVLPPCVFVLANGGRTSMYVNRGDGENWEDVVTRDLLAHLEATWRIAPERSRRALMGISMGGMAALRIGFTQPGRFGTVAVHSAAVFPADPGQLPDRMKQMVARFGMTEVFGDPIDPAKWRLANPLCLGETVAAGALEGLRLYFDAGTEDRYRFADANGQLHEVLERRKIPHTWRLVQGGGHAWGSGFQEDSLLASLAFVGQGLAAAEAAARGRAGLEGLMGGKGDGKEAGAAPTAAPPRGRN